VNFVKASASARPFPGEIRTRYSRVRCFRRRLQCPHLLGLFTDAALRCGARLRAGRETGVGNGRERSARRRGFTGAKLGGGIRARRSPPSLFALISLAKQSPRSASRVISVAGESTSHRVTYDESYVCTTTCKYTRLERIECIVHIDIRSTLESSVELARLGASRDSHVTRSIRRGDLSMPIVSHHQR